MRQAMPSCARFARNLVTSSQGHRIAPKGLEGLARVDRHSVHTITVSTIARTFWGGTGSVEVGQDLQNPEPGTIQR